MDPVIFKYLARENKIEISALMDYKPFVSVIMSVFNSELYLRDAIDSILSQTYDNFEFIIFDDKSIDRTGEILKSYTDSRIKIINNEGNIGLTRSLNKGLKLAQGNFIARMDADDISLPERLERQVDFLLKNPLVGLCGTWVKYMGNRYIYKLPVTYNEIHATLFKTNCLAHPTFMFNKTLLKRYHLEYNENFTNAQDYELVSRCIDLFKVYNIPEVLLYYRIHTQQISVSQIEHQSDNADVVRITMLKKLITSHSITEEKIHLKLMKGEFYYFKNSISTAINWLRCLKLANLSKKKYPVENFNELLFNIENELYIFILNENSMVNKAFTKFLIKCILIFKLPAKWFYHENRD